ncbi:MAG: orotidine-5'-phosphate decarboxylase [Gammaproteobacteria bacterium]|nr:orotidine-5'-phosphate decarboxylase [Gammaproteobacteria bacterium]
MLCVGLDPEPSRLPLGMGQTPAGIIAFHRSIIGATADLACAYKPQIAHFSAIGAEAALIDCIAAIRELAPHAVVILDAKRGDIGSTAEMYAREAFDRYGADAVTLNPYLGGESLLPFLEREDRGTVILCRTSNPGAGEIQDWPESDPLYARIARLAVSQWNPHGNLMLVAGATRPAELQRIRALAPEVPLLVPGLGAQGGDLEAAVDAGLDARGRGLVVNSSRAILYAGSGPDFAEMARAEALRMRDALRTAVGQVMERRRLNRR